MIRIILVALLLFIAFQGEASPQPTPAPTPTPSPMPIPNPPVPPDPVVFRAFSTKIVPKVKETYKDGSLYSEVMNRHATGYVENSRTTSAHETAHFINSDLRNAWFRQVGNNAAAFYIAPDKGFYTTQPSFRKNQIAAFVPNSLRFSRFPVYITGQTEWDDKPLYIFDEWTAYIIGGQVGIDDHKRSLPKSDQIDVVEGAMEFSIYAISTCMAIEKHDPKFWEDKEFRNFVYFLLHRSKDVFNEGKVIFPFKRQDGILENLKNSADAKPMRDFITKYFDGVFLND